MEMEKETAVQSSIAVCRTLENYAKWIMTWQVSDIFLPDSTIRESLILFRQSVLGEPSMDQQQQCVQIVENVLPLALGRVYAEYILPSGYKVILKLMVARAHIYVV